MAAVLTPADYVGFVEADSKALAEAARAGGIEAACPSCPDWTIDRLVGHIGGIHQWVTEIVRRRATEPVDRRSLPRPPGGDANLAWFDDQWHALVDALRGTDPETETWNFTTAPHRAAFWFRRMAHETAMHRVDAEMAAGRTPQPIPTELALDGVDELLAHMLTMRGNPGEHMQGSVHLHATDVPDGPDGGGEWMVVFAPDATTVTHEHGKGDAAVRGPASDLLLLIANRRDAEGLQVFGDASLLEQWRQHVHL